MDIWSIPGYVPCSVVYLHKHFDGISHFPDFGQLEVVTFSQSLNFEASAVEDFGLDILNVLDVCFGERLYSLLESVFLEGEGEDVQGLETGLPPLD